MVLVADKVETGFGASRRTFLVKIVVRLVVWRSKKNLGRKEKKRKEKKKEAASVSDILCRNS